MTTFVFISLSVIVFLAFCIAGHIKKRRKKIRCEQEQKTWNIEQRRKKATMERRLRALQNADIDNMNDIAFQEYISCLLQQQGFSTFSTPENNDLGTDILAEKDGRRYAIQTQRSSGPISRRSVNAVIVGQQHYDCNGSMVIANGVFAAGAEKLARSSGCILVDRDLLAEWIIQYQRKSDEYGYVADSYGLVSVGERFFED